MNRFYQSSIANLMCNSQKVLAQETRCWDAYIFKDEIGYFGVVDFLGDTCTVENYYILEFVKITDAQYLDIKNEFDTKHIHVESKSLWAVLRSIHQKNWEYLIRTFESEYRSFCRMSKATTYWDASSCWSELSCKSFVQSENELRLGNTYRSLVLSESSDDMWELAIENFEVAYWAGEFNNLAKQE